MSNEPEVRFASWRNERYEGFGFSYSGNPPSKSELQLQLAVLQNDSVAAM